MTLCVVCASSRKGGGTFNNQLHKVSRAARFGAVNVVRRCPVNVGVGH